MSRKNDKRRGFSLVEMIIYISILVFLLGIIMSITVSIITSQRKVNASRSIENSAMLALERVSRELRAAVSIDIVSSVFDTDPGILVLDSTDEDGNPRTIKFSLSSGAIYLEEDGVIIGPVTQADARVNDLIFRRFTSGVLEGARVELTLESGTSTSYRVNNFYSSSIIR